MDELKSFTPIKRRLSFTPKTPKKSKLDDKKVAKIAKKVVMRAAETKSSLTSYNVTPIDGAWSVSNLSFPIGQGDTAEDVIGEKVHMKSLNIRGNIYVQNNNAGTTTIARLVVFRSKQNLTTSSATITATDLVRATASTNPQQHHIDLHKVDLLYDTTLVLTPQVANSQTIQQPFVINIPVNKTHYFDSDNSGLFKDKQYYLGFVGYNGIIVSSPAGCTFTAAVNFKDM